MSGLLIYVGVAVMLVALVMAVVQLIRGDIGGRSLRGESEETRRAVRRAIRRGATDDAGVDRLARELVRTTPRPRWPIYVFGTLLAVAVIQLAIGPYGIRQIVLGAAEAALWAVLIALSVVSNRRLAGYRGMPS